MLFIYLFIYLIYLFIECINAAGLAPLILSQLDRSYWSGVDGGSHPPQVALCNYVYVNYTIYNEHPSIQTYFRHPKGGATFITKY